MTEDLTIAGLPERPKYRRPLSAGDKAVELGDIDPLDDGYLYYWPRSGGALSAYDLRSIANKLDELNKPWDDQVQEYFADE